MPTAKEILQKLKIRKGFPLISMPSVLLTEEEADRFIDYVWDESVMKDYARIEKMGKPQKNIRAIGFGAGKFLYPADQFNESKYKKQWAQNRIQLQTVKIRGCVAIYDDDIEDLTGIETEDSFNDKVMRIISAKVATELEEMYWMGDTHNLNGFAADDINSLLDGWRYIITHSKSTQTYYNKVTGSAYVLNACECQSGAECPSGSDAPDAVFKYPGGIAQRSPKAPYDWEIKYSKMIKHMPSKYKGKNGLANMRFLNSDLITQDYHEMLSSRGTAIGDAVLTGKTPPGYGKVEIVDVPLMPTDLGIDTDGTNGKIGAGEWADVLLTPKENLIIGIQREIKMETKREPSDEATYLYYSMRVACAIENVNAIVLTTCLTHEC